VMHGGVTDVTAYLVGLVKTVRKKVLCYYCYIIFKLTFIHILNLFGI